MTSSSHSAIVISATTVNCTITCCYFIMVAFLVAVMCISSMSSFEALMQVIAKDSERTCQMKQRKLCCSLRWR